MAQPPRALVHRRLDGWLLGGLGVVAWIVVAPLGAGHAPLVGVVAGALVACSAMHFGSSYHLAYAGGWADARRHPWALIAAPAALAATCVALVALALTGHAGATAPVVRALLVAVFSLTGWHYVKQAFGVGMLAARTAGLAPTRREALVLRYTLYPLWIASVVRLLEHGRDGTSFGVDVTLDVLPTWATPVVVAVGAGSLLVAAAVVARLGLRAGRVPPLGLWATYLAGGLWFLAPPTFVSATVVLAGLHGVQYLACVHRAEVDLAVEQREPHLLHRWLCVFGGAAAGGLLVVNWLPSVVGRSVAPAELRTLVPILVFVAFNLHHYAIDAVVWRSSGAHVRRITRGPATGVGPIGPEGAIADRPGAAAEATPTVPVPA